MKSAYVLADQEAPENQENLIEQVFCSIMKLPEEKRNYLHKKYLERYGWRVE